MLPIITAPHPVLSQIAKPVKKIDNQMQTFIKEMIDTLNNAKDPEGVGLAAPQVGKSLQLFIAKPSNTSPILTCINPTIVSHDRPQPSPLGRGQVFDSEGQADSAELTAEALRAQTRRGEGEGNKEMQRKKKVKLEGCLSLVDIWGKVQRDNTVRLSYLDENGKKHTRTFAGFLSTIVQHEYDHLQGILFPKRVLEQKGKLYKSAKDEKGETVFEEISI